MIILIPNLVDLYIYSEVFKGDKIFMTELQIPHLIFSENIEQVLKISSLFLSLTELQAWVHILQCHRIC